MKLLTAVLVLLAADLFLWTARAAAIPAFARRYETACTTCHVVPPKLNAFGVAFKNNGYRIPVDDEKFVKQPDVPLGAPGWKKIWPKGVWPGAIPDRVPLSVGVEMVADVNPSDPVKLNFAFPEEIELLGGGTLGDSLSFFSDLAFEFGDGTEVGLERGHFNMQLSESHLANLRLGLMETGATPFSRFSYRLTDADYIVSDFRSRDGGFRFRARQQGLELWGAKNGPTAGGFQYSAGIVNGSGDSSDNNSQKDVYANASYKFGGYGVTGPAGAGAVDTLKSTDNFIDNSVEIGAFGYRGWAGEADEGKDDFTRVGFKVNAYLDRLNVFGAYVRARDTLPTGVLLSSNAWFIEGDVVTLPWIVGIVRYDQAEGDDATFLNVKRVVPAVSMMIRANVILSAEANIYVGGEKNGVLNGDVAHNKGAVRLAFLF
ncbi:MAG: hypothetical protein HY047_20080 [Acidobacteria bacterium]|nr:hypothetical protein [Acidobacteriota bacterium]